MPTILELFKGSNKDITPKILDLTPVQDKFTGSPQEKAVKAKETTLLKQEFSGIRVKSLVELNNPLIYGNEAIRIATRSTSAVEKMKQATGGTAGDGGLIGKGLGKITEGKFGKFVFGGKVTSLSQARDGVNTRLGIPQNIIPTYVNNTGGLQAGIESDTMITLAKIKNDAKGTLLGQFLKQTGGGNPKTIGTQVLGNGISLVKDKVRTALFGNPNSLGANNASARDSFSGIDSGGKKPANGGWEYSSNLPYSKQISNVKFNTKVKDGLAESAATNLTKKITQLQEDAKTKLGEASANATAALKKKLRGSSSKSELDKFLDEKKAEKQATAVEKPSYDRTYSTLLNFETISDNVDGIFNRIDLSLVSPVYGIDRRATNGVYGKTEYAFGELKNTTGLYSPYNPKQPFTQTNKNKLESIYGITSNKGDAINKTMISPLTKDLIPVWMSSVNGGGSVQFRAVLTGFSETVSPSWDSSKFVGNPFPFWTYSGVERSASFTLKLYCQNEEELAMMWEKINFLTQKAYPTIVNKLVEAPFINLTLGNIYHDTTGFINSLSYTVEDDVTWETEISGLFLPKIVNVQIEFKLVELAQVNQILYKYAKSQAATTAINTNRAQAASQAQTNTNATNANLSNGSPNSTAVSGTPVTGGGGSSSNVVPVQSISTAKNVTPMTGLSGMKLPTLTPVVIPPPPKVDTFGNENDTPPSGDSGGGTSGGMMGMAPANEAAVKGNTEQTKGGVDSTPKSLETGKPVTDTPKQQEQPASAESIATTGESAASKISANVPKEYAEYPQWAWGAFRYSKLIGFAGSGKTGKVSNIKKIDEKNYYFKATDGYGNENDFVVTYVSNDSGQRLLYEVWSTQNDGKDPMGLIEWEYEPLPGEKKN